MMVTWWIVDFLHCETRCNPQATCCVSVMNILPITLPCSLLLCCTSFLVSCNDTVMPLSH